MAAKINDSPHCEFPEWNEGEDFNTSFRLLSAYHPGSDCLVLRIDVLANVKRSNESDFPYKGDQFCATLNMGTKTDLLIPKHSVDQENKFAGKVRGNELVEILRGLADKLEFALNKNQAK